MMTRVRVVACLVAALFVTSVWCRKGILELDSTNFDKLVGTEGKNFLVAFVEFSWKDPSEYDKVAEEFTASPDAVVAKVDCSDAKELKQRYDVEAYPTVMCFAAGSKVPQRFDGDAGDSASVVDFFRGCMDPQVAELKGIAAAFLGSEDKAAEVARAEGIVGRLGAESEGARYGRYVLGNMRKIAEKGAAFVESEKARLQALIDNKSTAQEKQKEFKMRVGILDLFTAKTVNASGPTMSAASHQYSHAPVEQQQTMQTVVLQQAPQSVQQQPNQRMQMAMLLSQQMSPVQLQQQQPQLPEVGVPQSALPHQPQQQQIQPTPMQSDPAPQQSNVTNATATPTETQQQQQQQTQPVPTTSSQSTSAPNPSETTQQTQTTGSSTPQPQAQAQPQAPPPPPPPPLVEPVFTFPLGLSVQVSLVCRDPPKSEMVPSTGSTLNSLATSMMLCSSSNVLQLINCVNALTLAASAAAGPEGESDSETNSDDGGPDDEDAQGMHVQQKPGEEAAEPNSKKRKKQSTSGTSATSAGPAGSGSVSGVKAKSLINRKKLLTPYLMFANSVRSSVREDLKRSNPLAKESEVLSAVAARWRSLSDTDREPWREKAQKDRMRILNEEEPHKPTSPKNPASPTATSTPAAVQSTPTQPAGKHRRGGRKAKHADTTEEDKQMKDAETQTDPEITRCLCSSISIPMVLPPEHQQQVQQQVQQQLQQVQQQQMFPPQNPIPSSQVP
ncbi:hypothetical protein Pelo_14758 [Pelomyxa schiedti]|nr:hypothetical protein Pelo_14758 [Pelomyxa schiedti]